MKKVTFHTVQSITKNRPGIATIGLKTNMGTENEAICSVGVVEYVNSTEYDAIAICGTVIGSYDTRSGAGHALARYAEGRTKRVTRLAEAVCKAPEQKYFSVAVAAQTLGKGVSTIRRWVKAGKLASKLAADGTLLVAA